MTVKKFVGAVAAAAMLVCLVPATSAVAAEETAAPSTTTQTTAKCSVFLKVNGLSVEAYSGERGITCDSTFAQLVEAYKPSLNIDFTKQQITGWTTESGAAVNTGAKISEPELNGKFITATVADLPTPDPVYSKIFVWGKNGEFSQQYNGKDVTVAEAAQQLGITLPTGAYWAIGSANGSPITSPEITKISQVNGNLVANYDAVKDPAPAPVYTKAFIYGQNGEETQTYQGADVTIAEAVAKLGIKLPEGAYWAIGSANGSPITNPEITKISQVDGPLYANYDAVKKPTTPKKYVVRFFWNNDKGQHSSKVNLYEGMTLTKADLPAPGTYTGYTFEGWFTGNGEKLDLNKKIDGNYYFTGRWTKNQPKKVSVSFVWTDNDGDHVSTPNTFKGGKLSKNDIPTVGPRDGYTFDGWYAADGTKFDINKPVNSDATYTAKWVRNHFTVTFRWYNDKGWNQSKPNVPAYGHLGANDVPDPGTYTGYKFVGWYATNGDKLDVKTTVIKGNAIYLAKWKKVAPQQTEHYTVTFHWYNNDGWHKSSPNVTKGGSLTEQDIPNPGTYDGYRFDGWYAPNGEKLDLAKKFNGNGVYLAKWVKASYKVTFHWYNNDGWHKSTVNVANGDTIKEGEVPDAGTYDGHDFRGWVTPNGEILDLNKPIDGNYVFTGRWTETKNYYKVSFIWYDNKGYHVSTPNVVKGGTLTEGEVPVPGARDGYKFKGFYAQDGTKFDITAPVTGNVVYTARWTKVVPAGTLTPAQKAQKKDAAKAKAQLSQTGSAVLGVSAVAVIAMIGAGVVLTLRKRA